MFKIYPIEDGTTLWSSVVTIAFLKPKFSIGGFEWIFISLSKSAAFSLQTQENNLKPP